MRYSLAYTMEKFSHCETALAVIQELLSALHKKDSWFNAFSHLLTARLLKPSPTASRCKDVHSHKQIEKKRALAL